MTIRILLIVALALVYATSAWSTERVKANDFVRFADNGNDLVIDLAGLDRALRGGADPNWIDPERKAWKTTLGHFLLMIGMGSRDPQTDTIALQAIKALIAAGAKLQREDREILYWPVASGKTDIVALLLNMGADPAAWPNEKIGTHYSPVETAAQEGHQAVVDLLVERGASRPEERDVIQWRFIHAASYGSADLLDDLRKKGADVNGKGRNNETALIQASGRALGWRRECEGFSNLLYLLDAGADPNISGNGAYGTTYPLHHAVDFSSYLKGSSQCGEMVKMILSELLTRGAHVSSLDGKGRTPLHIAAQFNHLLAARLLLKAGAKVKPRDETGKTPLDYAESGEMIKLLKSHGATER